MPRHREGWKSVAERQGAEIEKNDDLVLMSSKDNYLNRGREQLLGIAMKDSYQKFRDLGMNSFFLPRLDKDIDYELGDAEDEVSEMFFGTEELEDFRVIGRGCNSISYLMEKNGEEAVLTRPNRRNYAIKDFMDLYTAGKALEEIQEDLDSDVRAVKPHFANPFFLFEEYAGEGSHMKTHRNVQDELEDAGYDKIYRQKAEELVEELEVPARLSRTTLSGGEIIEEDGEYRLTDSGLWVYDSQGSSVEHSR